MKKVNDFSLPLYSAAAICLMLAFMATALSAHTIQCRGSICTAGSELAEYAYKVNAVGAPVTEFRVGTCFDDEASYDIISIKEGWDWAITPNVYGYEHKPPPLTAHGGLSNPDGGCSHTIHFYDNNPPALPSC